MTRPSYVKLTDIDERTATRDLVRAAEIGLLEAVGERRGRYYVVAAPLVDLRREIRESQRALDGPYPSLTDEIRGASFDRFFDLA